MELLYRIHEGLRPNLLDRLLGMREPKEMVQTVSLCLTEPTSKKMLPLRMYARIFGRIIHRIADGRTIRLLFPYDVKKVKKNLSIINVDVIEESGWLWLEFNSLQLLKLIQVLEASSFTTFYAQVNGEKVLPRRPTVLFDNLKHMYFLVVFTLYDESIEILSISIPPDVIVNFTRQLGTEEDVTVR